MVFLSIIYRYNADRNIHVGPMKTLERIHYVIFRQETKAYLALLIAAYEALNADAFN